MNLNESYLNRVIVPIPDTIGHLEDFEADFFMYFLETFNSLKKLSTKRP